MNGGLDQGLWHELEADRAWLGWPGSSLGTDLSTHARDLGPQGAVFGLFALQEAHGDARLRVDALRDQQVEVGACCGCCGRYGS